MRHPVYYKRYRRETTTVEKRTNEVAINKLNKTPPQAFTPHCQKGNGHKVDIYMVDTQHHYSKSLAGQQIQMSSSYSWKSN